MSASIDTPVASAGIAGLTASVAGKLRKGLGVVSVRDLIEQVPRRYIDLSRTKQIRELKIGEDATVVATIAKVEGRPLGARRGARPAKGRRPTRHLLTVLVSDGTGYLQLVWWNQPFRERAMTVGAEVAVAGKVERNRGKLSITNPFIEVARGGPGVHVGRIIPVHPATAGVSATQIRRFVHEGLRRYGDAIGDPLPPAIVAAHALMPRAAAIRELHFPSEDRARFAARSRLVFEELFVLSTGLAMRRKRVRDRADGMVHDGGEELVEAFIGSLPFEPTRAQRRVLTQIRADLAAPHQMNRLLQGEVGSGKTVVAVAAALAAHAAGSQTALMAPTEVLAEQHLQTVRALLGPLAASAPAEGRLFGGGFEVALLTGSVTGKERTQALEAAASGSAMMLIGTHALIQEGVAFHRLGLAVIDEQHRFGVHQRILLRGKGASAPDTLIMTATPIPRTLALTLYGDLDVSALDEMPAGRHPVVTTIAADDAARAAAYDDIRGEVAAGHQAFIVCPLVEDSAALEAKAATSEYERIRAEVFPDLRVGLIHGRMRSDDKEETMRAMRAGDLDVLVATTVIEVGVDLPRATVMVIEDADRFGLSQLHQLRGRIGRGGHPSRCYLFTTIAAAAVGGTGDAAGGDAADAAREEAIERLRAMASTTDGFELAEKDLALRGGGHLFGSGSVEGGAGAPAQAGRSDLQFANLARDLPILERAREAAFALVEADPELADPAHAALLDDVKRRFADRLDWLFAS